MHRLRRRRSGLRGRGHQVLVHLVRRCVRRLLLVALHAGAHVLVVGGAAVGAAVGESMMSRHSCTVCSRVADATSRAVALVRVGEAWVRRRDRRGRRHRCLSGLARATLSARSSARWWPHCARRPCMTPMLSRLQCALPLPHGEHAGARWARMALASGLSRFVHNARTKNAVSLQHQRLSFAKN